MSYITHTGYGYRKRVCEDVTAWFLNRFFPRHKIQVDIVHRGLNREQVYGYCDVVGETYRPRHFLIELNTYMDDELYNKNSFARTDAPATVGGRFAATPTWKNVLW